MVGAQQGKIATMNTQQINQVVTLHGSLHDVYEALLASDVGEDARNVDLVLDSKIVQSWRATDTAGWPKHHWSVIRFDLSSNGHGTKVKMSHIGVPEVAVEEISASWFEYLWQPLEQQFGG